MKHIFLFIILSLLISCIPKQFIKENGKCGIGLNPQKISELQKTSSLQSETIYASESLYSIYDQINDSLRSSLPDSLEFEIFLNTLDSNHFSFHVFAYNNKELLDEISCNYFKIKLIGNVPNKRIICLFSYSKNESGDLVFEAALKNK